ncbi:carboxymuconolactone decarboxylase family protein [Ferrimonas balearica]|uniref:carboxymuconolactone decarboxylase family protein n=1 Tax=Ferrimonas balearica TaxID=44012 RepID=UPI001C994349|nr:carboxymuconolactone decarboxylase family protein [Ferrimonas balearica]MBY5991167.1 carboxymuconolactone decarboxylase family protein [Ferrimonas balearica]
MSQFTIHNLDTVPAGSRATLEQVNKQFGMVPNLLGVLAEAPGILDGYLQLHQLFSQSSFNAEELTVVWQTINVEHECTYCVPAHTGIAHSMKVNPALTEALRNGQPMPSDKLQVLHETTLQMVRSRGRLTGAEQQRFFDAGFTQRQMLEIVLGLSQKVISNYVNHLAETPVDKVYQRFAWQGA